VALQAADIVLGPGINLAPGDNLSLPVSLVSPARPGGVTISLSSSDTSKVTINPANIYVPEGATAPQYLPRLTGVNFGSATIFASAFGLIGDSEIVQVSGRLMGSQSQSILRGTTVQLMFALASPVSSSLSFAVSSDNPAVAGVPSSATIPTNGSILVVPV